MHSNPSENEARRKSFPASRVMLLVIGVVALPAALTLRTVRHPGTLVVEASNPTPLGYTWSLLLFIIPLGALAWWFFQRKDLTVQRRAFWTTVGILVPTGTVMDLLFGNRFFTFTNHGATLGIAIPAVGGPIPVEEFVFYLSGFMVVLLTYLWCDEYWMRAYNIPDYRAAAREIPRLVRFHPASAVLGAVLLASAIVFKKWFSPVPEGFPWYFTYLVAVAIVPAAGFFKAASAFINWRALSFTCFFILLVSLLWEVTLAMPYGWWGFHREAMIGLFIGAWFNLPIEEVCVWLAVSFVTVITYEVIKIWRSLGTRTMEAFFGIR